MEVMHKRNAHNFPLDLAAAEATPVALIAPAIGRSTLWNPPISSG
jgi:photosystem II P680 reaction center D1 protein